MSGYPTVSTWMGKPITPENFSKEELVAMIDRLIKERDDTRRAHMRTAEVHRMFAQA